MNTKELTKGTPVRIVGPGGALACPGTLGKHCTVSIPFDETGILQVEIDHGRGGYLGFDAYGRCTSEWFTGGATYMLIPAQSSVGEAVFIDTEAGSYIPGPGGHAATVERVDDTGAVIVRTARNEQLAFNARGQCFTHDRCHLTLRMPKPE